MTRYGINCSVCGAEVGGPDGFETSAEADATWNKRPHLVAMLFNEAREPIEQIKLKVCHERIVREGNMYRLAEYSTDGAAYYWCGFAPTEAETATV